MWTLLWPVQPLKRIFKSSEAMLIDEFLTYVPDFVKGSSHELESGKEVILDGAGSNLFHVLIPSEFDDIEIAVSTFTGAATWANGASSTWASGATATWSSGSTLTTSAGSTANLARYCSPLVTDTYAANLTMNFSQGNNHYVVLTGNISLDASNSVNGSLCTVTLQQDGTGGRTVSWDAGTFAFGALSGSAASSAGDTTVWLFYVFGGLFLAVARNEF